MQEFLKKLISFFADIVYVYLYIRLRINILKIDNRAAIIISFLYVKLSIINNSVIHASVYKQQLCIKYSE